MKTSLRMAVGAALVYVGGCSVFSKSEAEREAIQPADFAVKPAGAVDTPASAAPAATSSAAAAAPSDVAKPANPTPPVTPPPANPNGNAGAGDPSVSPELARELDKIKPPQITASPLKDGTTLTVNAMIGQVNGRPLYASEVLQPLEGQFRAIAARTTKPEFRAVVDKVIYDRLFEILFNILYLGEAERNLTEQERFSVKIVLRLNREELVRKHGSGSEARADEELKRKTGKNMEETLEGIRQRMLVEKYQNDIIFPKISVSRRDVERFYNEPANYDKFNPKPGRKIRVIRVARREGDNPASLMAKVERIEKALAEGKPFAEVATDQANLFNREGGGKFTLTEGEKTTDVIQGTKLFGPEPVNEAIAKLGAGQRSERITSGAGENVNHWWVYIEDIITGKSRSLQDAQLEIEQILKAQQYQIIETRYRKKLFEDAGLNIDPANLTDPMNVMRRSLVDIAMNLHNSGT